MGSITTVSTTVLVGVVIGRGKMGGVVGLRVENDVLWSRGMTMSVSELSAQLAVFQADHGGFAATCFEFHGVGVIFVL